MQEIIHQLGELRNQDRFLVPQDWEARGLNPSPSEIIERMKAEVIKYIDFILTNLELGYTSSEELTDISQHYMDSTDFWYDLDTEENEWVYDEFCLVMGKIGVNPNDLLV